MCLAQEGEAQPDKQQETSGEDQQEQGEGQGSPEEMSRKEAQMLLDDFRRQEVPFGELRDDKQAKQSQVLKDW